MKRIALAAALLSAALFTADVTAGPGDKQGGRKAGAGQGAKGAGGFGAKGGQRGGPGRPGAGMQRDPAEMIARMMSEFDKDGDQKLDVTELTSLLSAMRERRGQAMMGRGGQGRPGQAGQGRPGTRPGGVGKERRGRNDEQDAAGGAVPKRPQAE